MSAGNWIVVIAVFGGSCAAAVAQPRAIDTQKSTMTVRVYKAGVLGAFGHDHQISAPISAGTADPTARQVELHVKSAALRVTDPDASEKDRAQIQATMTGPEVLNTAQYPDIVFHSTRAQQAGDGSWTVSGDLALHGQTRPVTVAVKESSGHYAGTARFKLTDFGIKPVKVAGGAVRVKDEIRIEFDIQLAR